MSHRRGVPAQCSSHLFGRGSVTLLMYGFHKGRVGCASLMGVLAASRFTGWVRHSCTMLSAADARGSHTCN